MFAVVCFALRVCLGTEAEQDKAVPLIDVRMSVLCVCVRVCGERHKTNKKHTCCTASDFHNNKTCEAKSCVSGRPRGCAANTRALCCSSLCLCFVSL